MTVIVELKGISKSFGGIRALRDVSFTIEQGEIVGLIGPNGAGKTTLVNIMTGATRASAGRIIFAGRDVSSQRPHQAARRGLARTFQVVQPFPRMTVLENVMAGALFGGAERSIDVKQAIEIARKQLEFAELSGFADKPAASLTIAGRKRLELAKSLAMHPKLLMLDEVNAGLNSSEIDRALSLIRKISERGMTILVIEHLMKVILSLARRVLVLHQGELVAQGPPLAIINDRRVVEAYLGEKFARRFQGNAVDA